MKFLIIYISVIIFISVNINKDVTSSEITDNYAKEIFKQANDQFSNAQKLISLKKSKEAMAAFKESSDQYENLIQSGYINGQIYYNLANAYYKQGKSGLAVLFYNKALKKIPRNSELKENIKLVKSEFEDKEIPNRVPTFLKTILFWHFLFNINELTFFTLSLYIIFISAFLAYIFCKYQWVRSICIGFGVAMIVTVVSLGFKIYAEQINTKGIIITKEVNVRYGPGEEFEAKFLIHEGAEFLVVEEKDDWYKVSVYVDFKKSDNEEYDNESKEKRVGWLLKNKTGII